MNRDVGELLTRTRDEFLDALIRGDSNSAELILDDAIARGLAPEVVYLDVVLPAQHELGRRWARGEISVSSEHLGTYISSDQLAKLRRLVSRKPAISKRAVVSTIEGDPHELPARVIADFLMFDGWDVDFMGTSTPNSDLVDFVVERGADLLVVSVTLEEGIASASSLMAMMRGRDTNIPVLLGGPAFGNRADRALALGSAGFAVDASGAQLEARRIVGIPAASTTLTQYLRGLGRRIQSERRKRKLSQQQLTERSGLDRAYISMVEHGKQNVTIGAIVKLAEALEIPYSRLLSEDTPISE